MSKQIRPYRLILALTALFIVALLFSHLTVQATGPVTCTVPSTDYPTIQSAVDDALCDIINVASGTFYERITINRSLEMMGKGASNTTVDGIAGGSVFTINGPSVILSDLAITNGSANAGGGIHNENGALTLIRFRIHSNNASGGGGGVYNKEGALTINGSTIEQNTASIGAGLSNEGGKVDISDSAIKSNVAGHHAGGVHNDYDGEMILTKTSIADNTCDVDGGGLFNAGKMTVYNSSIHGNKSLGYSGGAIRCESGTTYVNNSTISGNKSSLGGPIDISGGTARINSSTITKNEGSPALDYFAGDIRIKNSIISGNVGKDCRGRINSDGYNLVGDASNCNFVATTGDRLNIQANLGALQGNPAYHPLLMGPGINAGNPNGCKDHLGQMLDADQRGKPRVGICDMGAFEYQGQFHQIYLPLAADVGCLDFFDDFSNPNSGWPVGEDAHVQFGYRSGEYQVRSKSADYLYLFEAPSCLREEYVAQADARWQSAPGLAYGLIFGIRGDFEQYYLFAVNSEYQVFWLDYRGPGGWQTLIDFRETPAIKKDKASNTIKVKREGNKIILVINDAVVASVNDSKIKKSGGAGVFSVPYNDREESDARFDDFIFRGLVGVNAEPGSTGMGHGRERMNTEPFLSFKR